jgi:low affinity Fe/Cu permease
MVFLIQNTQNRESKALQLKLDELIYAIRGAKNEMIDIESLTEVELEMLAKKYEQVSKRCRGEA